MILKPLPEPFWGKQFFPFACEQMLFECIGIIKFNGMNPILSFPNTVSHPHIRVADFGQKDFSQERFADGQRPFPDGLIRCCIADKSFIG
ncbi:hypothetical protein D1872_327560 [compost metagenome]